MFDQISIKICSPEDKIVYKLEIMLKEWLPKEFRDDFHGEHIKNHPMSKNLAILLLILNNREIIGGAILADGLSLNNFKDRRKIAKIEEYKRNNILNFSYFYILSKYRRKGFGTEFLTKLYTLYPNSWLASSNKLLKFYNRNGYKIVYPPIVKEENFLLVRNKK